MVVLPFRAVMDPIPVIHGALAVAVDTMVVGHFQVVLEVEVAAILIKI